MPDREPVRILIVEDDAASARLERRMLERAGFSQITVVSTAVAALQAADQADIILLDHQLPDTSGLDVLTTLRARPSQPSVIVITAHGSEATAASALRYGADDYLSKDATLATLLPEVVERVRRNRALGAALASAERELVRAERLAAIGEMTVTLHHEINNPLMAASASVDFLLHRPVPLPDDAREAVEDIAKALERIRLIVRRVGSLKDAPSRDYPGGMKMVDLHAPGGAGAAKGPGVARGVAAVWTRTDELGRVVAMLLKGEGFTVERCVDAEALTTQTRRLGTTLLVAEAADAVGGDPLGGFRPAADRDYSFVLLTVDRDSAPEDLEADLVLETPIDPATFAHDILGCQRRA
jgi:CheY-like chemotaxis protein